MQLKLNDSSVLLASDRDHIELVSRGHPCLLDRLSVLFLAIEIW